jgi:hypothetical protein
LASSLITVLYCIAYFAYSALKTEIDRRNANILHDRRIREAAAEHEAAQLEQAQEPIHVAALQEIEKRLLQQLGGTRSAILIPISKK